jgi:ATP-dependent helicase/nuclease subunit A
VPDVVRPLADVPGGAALIWQPNPEQQAAIEAKGRVFVSAGAGTGKTAVLVERFVRAVCDEGMDVESILVITYTKRAAGELRARIRAELRRRGRADLARELDGAWISTIHGFCNRLLKTYPFEAGLDPRFRELDESQSAVLSGEAFDEALAAFCADGHPDHL